MARVSSKDLTFIMQGHSISKLRKERQILWTVLVALLSDLVTHFKVKENIKGEIDSFAEELIDSPEWYFLKIEEIKYVFDQMKIGRFVKVYERLDKSIIYEAFSNYDRTDRMRFIESHNTALKPDSSDRTYRYEFEREESKRVDAEFKKLQDRKKAKDKLERTKQ